MPDPVRMQYANAQLFQNHTTQQSCTAFARTLARKRTSTYRKTALDFRPFPEVILSNFFQKTDHLLRSSRFLLLVFSTSQTFILARATIINPTCQLLFILTDLRWLFRL